jgi:23S rRNA (uracil1939-C5)-methyltransferase
VELKIEKLIYGGDGLARMASDNPERAGKAVFLPFTIPGETVEARMIEQKPGFARARAQQVLQSSPDRTQPGCPYFGDCGGCQYQHMTYESQLRAKADILRETIQRTAKLTPPEIQTHASPPWNYRNRTRTRVQVQPQFAIGYNRFASHTLLPVRECPISSPLVNRTLTALWKLGEAGQIPPAVVEIEFFANAADTELLLEAHLVDGSRRVIRELATFADALRTSAPEMSGVVPFVAEGKGDRLRRVDIPEQLQQSFGGDSLFYRTAGMQYQVSAGSFFQTNRYLVDAMVALVTSDVSGDSALDLYSGVGLFALPLSQTFREVAAVEVAPFSFHDLKANSPSNVHAHRLGVDQFLVETEAPFDYVVVDPPRGGVGAQATEMLAALRAPRLTYVSCDPATLARDLKVLAAAGYKVGALHLLDLFPQTFHIETVAQLTL